MKYLLVMPKKLATIDHFDIFPIGIAYVSASMKKAGFDTYTANLDSLEGSTRELLDDLIKTHRIDVICTGGLSRDYHKIKEVIDIARSIHPGIKTVVGGGLISADPEPAMKALEADIGVMGEGEVTMCELASALDDGIGYEEVPGLIYRSEDGRFLKTPKQKEIENLDSIPLPDFEGFDYSRWVSNNSAGLILTDRSCPFKCTFCFHPTGSRYRQRSLDNIFNEIEYQIEKYDIKSIGSTSELFATSRKRVTEFCDRISKYGITWGCCLRVTDIERDLMKLMKKSGCVNVVMGLESADNTILKSMGKRTTVDQIENALMLTYEEELNIEAGFIFGDIKETRETMDRTLTFWREHNDDHYINLSMISVLPGSYLYEYACTNHIIKDREQFLRDGCPLTNVSQLNSEQYTDLRSRVAELRFHPHVPAKSFHIDEIDSEGVCKISYSCRKCGKNNEDEVFYWYGKESRCQACGLINFIDPYEKSAFLEEDFLALVPEGKRIAIWGAGGIYYKLMQKYNNLSSDRFILVDANSSQQGLSICGKEIFSPKVIEEEGISIVIIAALSHQENIHSHIKGNYRNVDKVLRPAFESTKRGVIPYLMEL